MRDQQLLQTGLIITVAGSLLAYHGMSAWDDTESVDVQGVWMITKIAVMALFIWVAISSRFIPKWLPGSEYISGKYEGQSTNFQVQPANENVDTEQPHDEFFTIKQSLFATTVTGNSTIAGKDYSGWTGRRFDTDGNIHYFGIQIKTPLGTDYGILQLAFKDNGDVFGFYLSGDPESTKRCTLSAKLIS